MAVLLVLAVSIQTWVINPRGLHSFCSPRAYSYHARGYLTSAPPPATVSRVAGLEGNNGALTQPRPRALGLLGMGPGTKPQSTDKAIGGQNNDEEQDGDVVEEGDLTPSNGPLIVRTAGLTVTVKEFDKARAALDEILKRHHGYMGELNVNVPSDAGR